MTVCLYPFTRLKIINDFLLHGHTDGQMDRHTNSIQNESTLYPIQGAGGIFFYPVFLPLTRSRRFVRIKSLAILKGLIKSWSKFKAYHG